MNEIYNAQTIKKYAGELIDVEFIEEVTSTNTVLKEFAENGACEGKTVVAGRQTGGKGRLGRSFYSPSDCGIYMSVLLRPDKSGDISLLTPMAALAVVHAVKTVTGKEPYIKWVNDVILDGKKICGILCETSYKENSSDPDHAVVGIGINMIEPDGGFPSEIADVAGAVCSCGEAKKIPQIRSMTAAETAKKLIELYRLTDKKEVVSKYRSLLFMLGKRIRVIKSGSVREAEALDIDGECKLLVRYDDGTEEYLNSGEVSCRLI